MGLGNRISEILKRFLKSKAVFLLLFFIILALVLLSRAGSGEDPVDSNQTVTEPPVAEENQDGVQAEDVPTINWNADMDVVFDGALFIGDSRTEGLKLFAGIKNADFFCAKSMSIDKVMDGNKVDVNGTQMSIYETLASKDYNKVYICLGLNELGWVKIEDFLAEYESLIEEIRAFQDNAEIYVELIVPVTEEKSNSDKVVNNGQIYWYNVNLIELAEKNGVKYLNPDAPLVGENGTLLPETTTDGVHIKREYCKKWAEYLAQITY